LKAAIKHSAGEDQVRHRIVPPEAVSKWAKILEAIKEEVAAILEEEKEEKHVSCHADLNIVMFIRIDILAATSRDGAQKGREYD